MTTKVEQTGQKMPTVKQTNHHSRVDGTKDPHGRADEHHCSEDGAEVSNGRAEVHWGRSGGTGRQSKTGAMSMQAVGLETIWSAGWLRADWSAGWHRAGHLEGQLRDWLLEVLLEGRQT